MTKEDKLIICLFHDTDENTWQTHSESDIKEMLSDGSFSEGDYIIYPGKVLRVIDPPKIKQVTIEIEPRKIDE